EAVGPGVGGHQEPGRLGKRGDLPELVDTFGQHRVWLEDVIAAVVDQALELMQAVVVLSSRQLQRAKPVPQPPEPRMVVTGQGLFQPRHAKALELERLGVTWLDRKSTRLNSSHVSISYAVFCLKKKKINSPRHIHDPEH